MLTDRYGLPLSTASSAARDAYVEGCRAKLTMYPGAIEAFDRAIAEDPHFALAHAARAHALLERGDAAAARASMAAANSLGAGLSAREASHIAFFDRLVAGDAETALSALLVHLNVWPRDSVVLGTAAFTNGLIGSSGRAGQKRMLLELLDRLAPSYGDDWWFASHHGMALSEYGQRDAARPMIERSLAQNPKNPWAAHACAHLCYEEGDPEAGRAFLTSWLTTYPRDGALYSHLSWHLALGHLEAGDAAAAVRLFREAFAPDVHSGPPRGKVTDEFRFCGARNSPGTRATSIPGVSCTMSRPVHFQCRHRFFRHAYRARRDRRRQGRGVENTRRGRSTNSGASAAIRPAPWFRRCRAPSPPSNGGDFSAAIDALAPIWENSNHRRQPRPARSDRIYAAEGVCGSRPGGTICTGCCKGAAAAPRILRSPGWSLH